MRLVIALLVLCAVGRADAYPQWQLSRDTTCASCHIAPDGGGLLNEAGLEIATAVAWKDHDPSFMYGSVPTPGWLVLGGDVRAALLRHGAPGRSRFGIGHGASVGREAAEVGQRAE